MNAYSAKQNESVVNRIRKNVYGWCAGGDAVNLEFFGGSNCGYADWMSSLSTWVSENQGL
eukprot:6865624-Alexandrium_andersonii.AAC.1